MNQKQKKFIRNVFQTFVSSNAEIKPHFILSGSTGSGKSYSIESFCNEFGLSYLSVNAAQLTAEGLSGNSLSKAIAPLANEQDNLVVCFVDEFDKLFIKTPLASSDEASYTSSVQNEFLKLLESDTTQVFGNYGKYVPIDISKVLFVFAGAFGGKNFKDINDFKDIGIRPEFLGRVCLNTHLEKESLDTYLETLRESPLLSKYLEVTGSKRHKVIQDLEKIIKEKYDKNTLGFRLINQSIHRYFLHES